MNPKHPQKPFVLDACPATRVLDARTASAFLTARQPTITPLSPTQIHEDPELVLIQGAVGGIMSDAMGSVHVDLELENPVMPGARRALHAVLVDTGAELSWFPSRVLESLGIERSKLSRFRQATGVVVERWTGEARVYLAGTRTIDEVVFGEPGDLVLLGLRSLEGLNLTVDPVNRRLIDAGPAPAAISVIQAA